MRRLCGERSIELGLGRQGEDRASQQKRPCEESVEMGRLRVRGRVQQGVCGVTGRAFQEVSGLFRAHRSGCFRKVFLPTFPTSSSSHSDVAKEMPFAGPALSMCFVGETSSTDVLWCHLSQ